MRRTNPKKNANHRASRSGVVMLAVLVCFGVVALILLATAKLSLSERRQLKRELQMQQTQSLADAAVALAIRSAANAEEDAWQQAAVELEGYDAAHIKWRINTEKELEVVATIGEPDRPAQKTKCEIRLRSQEWNPEKENRQ